MKCVPNHNNPIHVRIGYADFYTSKWYFGAVALNSYFCDEQNWNFIDSICDKYSSHLDCRRHYCVNYLIIYIGKWTDVILTDTQYLGLYCFATCNIPRPITQCIKLLNCYIFLRQCEVKCILERNFWAKMNRSVVLACVWYLLAVSLSPALLISTYIISNKIALLTLYQYQSVAYKMYYFAQEPFYP